jgi:hypothetical protein
VPLARVSPPSKRRYLTDDEPVFRTRTFIPPPGSP